MTKVMVSGGKMKEAGGRTPFGLALAKKQARAQLDAHQRFFNSVRQAVNQAQTSDAVAAQLLRLNNDGSVKWRHISSNR